MASVSVNTICLIRNESEHKRICASIQNYLSNGGLFNPELMQHEKVRDMILEFRDYLCPPNSTDQPGRRRNTVNQDDHDFYRDCAIAAMQELIKKVPLADKNKGDDVDAISNEICMSADRYAVCMVNLRRGRIDVAYPPNAKDQTAGALPVREA